MSAVPSVTADLAASLEARLARFPAQQAVTAAGQTVGYREAQAGALVNHDALPLVLLHGIGSGAASWVQHRPGSTGSQQTSEAPCRVRAMTADVEECSLVFGEVVGRLDTVNWALGER